MQLSDAEVNEDASEDASEDDSEDDPEDGSEGSSEEGFVDKDRDLDYYEENIDGEWVKRKIVHSDQTAPVSGVNKIPQAILDDKKLQENAQRCEGRLAAIIYKYVSA